MIYVIKSGDKLKVGYTQNLEKRLISYRTHNPHIELITTMAGERKLEQGMHKHLAKYRVEGEWFEYNDQVMQYVRTIEECVNEGLQKTITTNIKVIDDDEKLLEEITIIQKVFHNDLELNWNLPD